VAKHIKLAQEILDSRKLNKRTTLTFNKAMKFYQRNACALYNNIRNKIRYVTFLIVLGIILPTRDLPLLHRLPRINEGGEVKISNLLTTTESHKVQSTCKNYP